VALEKVSYDVRFTLDSGHSGRECEDR